MSELDNRINSLSSDELDMLNSDPQMLSEFKAKYSSSSPSGALSDALKTGLQEGVRTALPSPSYSMPLAPTSSNPILGGIEAAGQTLRDPTRISPTISQPGQIASESQVGQNIANKVEDTTGIPAPVSKFVEAALLDPQTYLGLQPGELPKGVQKQLSSLGDTLTGIDKEGFMKLANSPREVLTAEHPTVSGARLQKAKELAGMTEEEERQLATKEEFRKKIYNDTLSKIDQATVKPGDKFIVTGDGKNLPDQSLTHKGPMMADDPARLKEMGLSDQTIKEMTQPSYDLSKDIPGHPAGSTVSKDTLVKAGYDIADKSDIKVSDLLRAKKAGQLMAKSDQSTAGFFQKEIHDKINPLLKEMAPDVYEAQQAYHLSKVKESFLNIFPQGKGMYKYMRTLGMLGGSLFHGIGALESPIVAGAATLAGSQGAKVALSPASLITAGKALNNSDMINKMLELRQGGFPISEQNNNDRALQSVRDRINNQKD